MNEKIKAETSAPPKTKTKNVRNKSNTRIELVFNEKVYVFLPGKTIRVPADADIPEGIGLYVR